MGDISYLAFLSYSNRYAGWVQTLQENLERCLEAQGDDRKIFLDKTDLGPGRSFVTQLQAGLDKAEQLILVVTPESLASSWASAEWEGFITQEPDWRSRLQIAFLIDAPLPPFLSPHQYVDFRDHDDASYRASLRELLSGLLGETTKRNLPELPNDVSIPKAPPYRVPRELRSHLVTYLSGKLGKKLGILGVQDALGIETLRPEDHPSSDCAASAALVEATGDEDPPTATLRFVSSLLETFEDEAELKTLRKELQELVDRTAGGGLRDVWLATVRQSHSELLPFFGEAVDLPLLDKVYVRLELQAERLEALRTETKELPFRERLELRDLLDLEPAEPWITRRWVVKGDPGAGKTTLLRHLAASLAGEEAPRWIPLFESLPRLMREREWFLDRLERTLTRAGDPARGLAAWLDQEGRNGRLLLLLDGLDEVPKEDRDDVEGLLRKLSARWPSTPIVVTTRPIGYRRPASDFRELQLLPLDRERQKEFLGRWLGRSSASPDFDRAEAVLARLEGEPSFRDLAATPLYLTLMALLIEEGDSPDRNRPELYHQVFELLMEGRHRPDPKPIPCRKAVRGVLRRVALQLTEENRDAEPVGSLENRLYQEEFDRLREPLERRAEWRRGMRPFLDDVANQTGILGPHDGRDADWRFWHRTFREALAAESLVETHKAEGPEALLEMARKITGDESRWAEPFALVTGRVENPDELVRTLVRENSALGLRALATAQNLAAETLREVLELSDKPMERAKVYERIPELVNDPERTLALLDQLRRSTRDGNDLFFLDLAAASAGDRWPEVQPAAEDLRSRLYDHIPAPPEELFRWIETPVDGRVELWREIPAGRFRMGSPEDEEGRYGQEGPQHEVLVKSPFRLAAVPVTNAQFAAFDPGHTPHKWQGVPGTELPHHPVVNVTWYQAVAFCRWLSASFPWTRGARLPTEEEWEYACRAGTETRFWSGDSDEDLARVGWYGEGPEGRTHRVGEKPANPWGLYDVHGNALEWTRSEWTDDYSEHRAGREIDPSAVDAADLAGASGAGRVIRGGAFWVGARVARSAYRNGWFPWYRDRVLGFRVLLPAAPRS